MTRLKDQLVANNNSVDWYPDYVGEKRFGNWLENVNDWAISRTRYWGTPLNIWRCDECGELTSIPSRKELVERAIEDIDESIELHRPYVDDVHLKCEKCNGIMTRVKEVIDCWFDSGSMPFAQYHYPFENKEIFEEQFPADYICEGIDPVSYTHLDVYKRQRLSKGAKEREDSPIITNYIYSRKL